MLVHYIDKIEFEARRTFFVNNVKNGENVKLCLKCWGDKRYYAPYSPGDEVSVK